METISAKLGGGSTTLPLLGRFTTNGGRCQSMVKMSTVRLEARFLCTCTKRGSPPKQWKPYSTGLTSTGSTSRRSQMIRGVLVGQGRHQGRAVVEPQPVELLVEALRVPEVEGPAEGLLIAARKNHPVRRRIGQQAPGAQRQPAEQLIDPVARHGVSARRAYAARRDSATASAHSSKTSTRVRPRSYTPSSPLSRSGSTSPLAARRHERHCLSRRIGQRQRRYRGEGPESPVDDHQQWGRAVRQQRRHHPAETATATNTAPGHHQPKYAW